MLVLERNQNEVFCNGRKLTIITQASKGPNHEVVKILGLPESNGQKWIALSKLKNGINEIECHGREISARKYTLTDDEQCQVDELQAQIDDIIENAKARYVSKPNLNVNIATLNNEQKQDYIMKLEAYLANVKKA